MASIGETFRYIAGAVKGRLTGDRFFYRRELLSREGIGNIHPGDSIRFVDSDESFTVTDTDAKTGLVLIGTGPRDFFETNPNRQVRIGCPGGRGH